MDEPKIAACCPKQVDLVAGQKYAYCTCGLAETQPFCDGAHRGTDFKPMVFEATDSESAYFCQCKRTADAPRCDGAHKSLPAPQSDGS